MRLVFNKLATWLIGRAWIKNKPNHIWTKKGDLYMERWDLFRFGKTRSGTYAKIHGRIHHIIKSDGDRAVHDHPWAYLTIILRGGYWEVTPVFDKHGIYEGETEKWYGPGSVLFRRAGHFHRVKLQRYRAQDGIRERSATTLFISFGHYRNWGFMVAPWLFKVEAQEYMAFDLGRLIPQIVVDQRNNANE